MGKIFLSILMAILISGVGASVNAAPVTYNFTGKIKSDIDYKSNISNQFVGQGFTGSITVDTYGRRTNEGNSILFSDYGCYVYIDGPCDTGAWGQQYPEFVTKISVSGAFGSYEISPSAVGYTQTLLYRDAGNGQQQARYELFNWTNFVTNSNTDDIDTLRATSSSNIHLFSESMRLFDDFSDLSGSLSWPAVDRSEFYFHDTAIFTECTPNVGCVETAPTGLAAQFAFTASLESFNKESPVRVSEPATAVVMFVGLLALTTARRNRQRRAI